MGVPNKIKETSPDPTWGSGEEERKELSLLEAC
jgi:hypothetical protein